MLIDKRTIGCGSTSANTALLLYELDTPLRELIEMIGVESANRVYRLCVDAVNEMGSVIAALGGGCGYEPRTSLYLASKADDAEALRDEWNVRRRCGIRCDYLQEREIAVKYGFGRPAAILSYDAAQLDPYALTQLLVNQSVDGGLRVFERTELDHCEASGDHVDIVTSAGCRIYAHRVIYATGYECTGEFPPPLTRSHITYAAVSEPCQALDAWPGRCLIWETARPYFYARTTSDGRIMIGGEDDDGSVFPAHQTLERKSAALGRKFAELFPMIPFSESAAWAGVFKDTRDGLPFIGPREGDPNSLFALGYGGNGMTFSVIAARIVCDICLGKKNPDVELFGFQR